MWDRSGGSTDMVSEAAPSGQISWFGMSTAPEGWLVCDGSAVSRTANQKLFSAVGTTWGVGDGTTTFNLPDLRGRTPIGTGQGVGLTNRTIADTGGDETHQLVTAELPTHNHTVTDSGHSHGVTDPGHTHPPGSGGGAFAVSAGSTLFDNTGANDGSTRANTGSNTTGLTVDSATTGLTVNNSGSDQAHENMPPFAALLPCIKT